MFAADLAQDGGARTAVAIMESILLDIMFDLPGPEGVKEVVISRQLVEDTTHRAVHLRQPPRSYRRRRASA
jgi:ATP-dependent protease Clp ATPase subunit